MCLSQPLDVGTEDTLCTADSSSLIDPELACSHLYQNKRRRDVAILLFQCGRRPFKKTTWKCWWAHIWFTREGSFEIWLAEAT